MNVEIKNGLERDLIEESIKPPLYSLIKGEGNIFAFYPNTKVVVNFHHFSSFVSIEDSVTFKEFIKCLKSATN
jgi:hypothetical protein